MTDHPITPPPELVKQWRSQWMAADGGTDSYQNIATQAARWGADFELDACCEWLDNDDFRELGEELRAARRPRPLSLKEQALAVLDDASDRLDAAHENIIRRALEQLDD